MAGFMPPITTTPRPISGRNPTGVTPANAAAPAAPASAPTGSAPPTGLEAASAAGVVPSGAVPSGTGTSGSGFPVGAGGLNLRTFSGPAGAGALDLIPGRVPNAVSLTTVLKQSAGTPQGEQLVRGIAASLEQKAGMKIPEAVIQAALAHPERVTEMLAFTPAQMQASLQGLHAAHRAGKIPATPPREFKLPNRVDLLQADKHPIKRSQDDLKEIAPGLFRGDVPSDLPDAQAAQNTRMAEVLDRLSRNVGTPAGERFTVRLGSREFTRVDTFLKALTDMGYQVDAVVRHRVADFAGLKTKAPNGSIIDVPACILVRTGIKDAQGAEAMVPTVHSEIVYSIRAGAHADPPGLDADVKWYQGVPNTGFFASGLNRPSQWCGSTEVEHWSGDQAIKAAKLSSLLGDIIRDSADAAGLLMSGYGVTGVCNDSVAVVQQAIAGRATAYPLLMQDATLTDQIQQRLTDKDRRDDPAYRELSGAMADVPSDAMSNASAGSRALASLPWAAGKEPFASVETARAILSAR